MQFRKAVLFSFIISTFIFLVKSHADNMQSNDVFFSAPVVYSKTTMTNAPVGSIVFDPSVGVFYGLSQTGPASLTTSWVPFNSSVLSGVGSTASATGGSGHGSTNTKIRHFSNGTSSTAVAYVSDSVNGDTFTILSPGVYSIVSHDNHNVATTVYTGISRNSLNLTTSIISIPSTELLDLNASLGGSSYGTATWTGTLNAGDIIRAHTDGVPTATLPYLVRFFITKVSN